jgi:WhiB family transcriptional regulator, redox-sensing transcriptional regulator
MTAEKTPEQLDAIAAQLDRLMWTPTDVLYKVVTENGLCFWAFTRGDIPAMSGEESADAALAARLCTGCPVQDECLELDLREAGTTAIGVWGAMTDDDRRALHPVWLHREDPTYGGAS